MIKLSHYRAPNISSNILTARLHTTIPDYWAGITVAFIEKRLNIPAYLSVLILGDCSRVGGDQVVISFTQETEVILDRLVFPEQGPVHDAHGLTRPALRTQQLLMLPPKLRHFFSVLVEESGKFVQ